MRGIEQTGFLPDGDQRSNVVEQIDEQEREDNFHQAQVQRRWNILLTARAVPSFL
jgi:hypothetical protein